MLIAIHQSHYLPWLGYIDKIDRADRFVVLDDVQFEKNDWQNRNRILSPQGWQWLTVPVRFSFGQTIGQVELADSRWTQKHWKSLVSAYGKKPAFKALEASLAPFYQRPWTRLVDVNGALLAWLLETLGVTTEVILSSELKVEGQSTQRLVSICKALGGTAYLYGGHGEDYMEMEAFHAAGIEPLNQRFQHPVYPQRLGKRAVEFVPGLSCVDLLFQCGQEGLSLLREANGRGPDASETGS